MSCTVNILLKRADECPRAQLSGEYRDKTFAAEVQDALALWKFYREILQHLHYTRNTHEDDELRKLFLSEAINRYRGMAYLVLQWESLPVSVVKTLLWRENIDFQSFESFLRRLTQPQMQAIDMAYYELFELEEVPTCMRVGRGKWLNRHMTVDSLLSAPAYEHARYTGKSAWLRNLASLDFGFGLYPNGPNDDTKARDHTRKFLSARNHINDFSVNKHDGVYWWLYRTLRSNYLWNRGGTVELKQHICPGFWLTMIMWVVLVMASPVLAILATIKYAALQLASKSWIVAKAANFVVDLIEGWAKRHVSQVEYFNAIWLMLLVTFCTLFTAMVAAIVAVKTGTSLAFITAPALLAFLTITKVIVQDGFAWRSDPPPFALVFILVTVLWLPIEHYDVTSRIAVLVWDSLATAVLWSGDMTMMAFALIAVYSLHIIASIVSVLMLLYIGEIIVGYTKKVYQKILSDKQPEYVQRWYRGGNIFGWALLILGVIAVPLVLYMPQHGATSSMTQPPLQTMEIVSIVASVLVALASVVFLLWLGSKEPKKVRIEKAFMREIDDLHLQSDKRWFFRSFISNVWMLRQPDRMSKIESLWYICEEVLKGFSYPKAEEYTKAGRDTFSVLAGYADCSEWVPHFVRSLLRGESYKDALRRFEETKEANVKAFEWERTVAAFWGRVGDRVDKIFTPIANSLRWVRARILQPTWLGIKWPFVTTWSAVRAVSLRIQEAVFDLYSLWKTFNEVCPHVAEEEDLRSDLV